MPGRLYTNQSLIDLGFMRRFSRGPLHHRVIFRWLDAVATGNRSTAIQAALDWNDRAAQTYGDDWLDDLLTDLAHEPANVA